MSALPVKIRFDEDLVHSNARELDRIARLFAKAERRKLYLRTMVKRIVKEMDLCEKFDLKAGVTGSNPNTAIFDSDPQTVHLAVFGDQCGWSFVACGGDADEEFVDGVKVEYGHKSNRTVNCPACMALLKRAERIRAKRPAVVAAPVVAPVAVPVVATPAPVAVPAPQNPFYAGKK